jgi:hypothetical protein
MVGFLSLISCGRLATPTSVSPTVNTIVTETALANRVFGTLTAIAKIPSATATATSTQTLAQAPNSPTGIMRTRAVVAPSPTATSVKTTYPAPVITSPMNNPTFFPGDLVITWSFPYSLKEDEWFEVLGWKENKPNERNSMGWTKEQSFVFKRKDYYLPQFSFVAGMGQYYLCVQIVRGKDGKNLGILSPESRSFPWRW